MASEVTVQRTESWAQEAAHEIAHEGGLFHGPRRPHFTEGFSRLRELASRSFLPTPPPQRVGGRGRQNITSSEVKLSLSKEQKRGRRGRSTRVDQGMEQGSGKERGKS
jgi:hypothetical protein